MLPGAVVMLPGAVVMLPLRVVMLPPNAVEVMAVVSSEAQRIDLKRFIFEFSWFRAFTGDGALGGDCHLGCQILF